MNPTKLLKRLHHDQDGTALTEFTICLPVWIFIMIGISNLQALGLQSTRVQIVAQKNLWINAIDATRTDNATRLSPRLAGPHYAGLNKTSATYSATPTLDAAASVHGAAITAGHWVESGSLVTAARPLGAPAATFLPESPSDRLNNRKVPNALLNDGLNKGAFSTNGGGANSIIGSVAGMLLSASGMTIPLATAVRYGVVSGAQTNHQIQLTGGTVTTGAQYDVLVAPKPFEDRRISALGINVSQSSLQPLLIARVLAEGEPNYERHMRWAKSEWQTNGGSNPNGNVGSGQFNDAAAEGNRQAGECREVKEHNDGVNSCRNGCPASGDNRQSCLDGCGNTRSMPSNCQG